MKLYSPKIVFIIIFISSFVFSQQINEQNSYKIYFNYMPTFQSWKSDINEELDFSQLSNIIGLNFNISNQVSFSFRGGYANINGDVDVLNGLSDSQIALKYRMQKYHLMLDGGINIPNGKKELTEEEFLTSRIVSQNIFSMQIPNLGQGLNYYLGGAWANPLSDNIAIGVGLSYQIRGAYRPTLNNPEYQPSNELLLTGGFDYRLTNTATVSLDATGMFYGSDKIDDNEVFSAGRRIIVNLMYRQFFNHNILSFLVRYRDQALDKLKGVLATSENEKVNPNQLLLFSSFRQRFSVAFLLSYLVEARFYEETISEYSGYKIYGLGLEPVIRFSSRFEIPIIFKYIQGTNHNDDKISGIEAGLGMRVWL